MDRQTFGKQAQFNIEGGPQFNQLSFAPSTQALMQQSNQLDQH